VIMYTADFCEKEKEREKRKQLITKNQSRSRVRESQHDGPVPLHQPAPSLHTPNLQKCTPRAYVHSIHATSAVKLLSRRKELFLSAARLPSHSPAGFTPAFPQFRRGREAPAHHHRIESQSLITSTHHQSIEAQVHNYILILPKSERE
jgi:hypothetical protein